MLKACINIMPGKLFWFFRARSIPAIVVTGQSKLRQRSRPSILSRVRVRFAVSADIETTSSLAITITISSAMICVPAAILARESTLWIVICESLGTFCLCIMILCIILPSTRQKGGGGGAAASFNASLFYWSIVPNWKYIENDLTFKYKDMTLVLNP